MSLLLLALLCAPLWADELPPPPVPPQPPDPYEPEDPPSFGSDASAGYGLGSLLGSWPDAGLHGAVLGRVEFFLVDRATPGPRLGLSLWGSAAVWPLQRFSEEDGPQGEPFGFTHYGVMTVLRGEPDARLTPAAGIGFGRLDLAEYDDGALAIPTLSFEAGPRIRAGGLAFLDLLARAHWGTTRSPTAESWHEWWMVQLSLSPGLHLR